MGLERYNQNLIVLIDELYMPTQEEIDEAGLKRLGRPANEKDYLINYLETSYKSRKSNLRHRLHNK